jgi:tryptophanase
VEIGTVMFGRTDTSTGREIPAAMELVRLAIPRRVYTDSHLAYVAGVLGQIQGKRDEIRGLRFTYKAKALRHFTARFEELETRVEAPVLV